MVALHIASYPGLIPMFINVVHEKPERPGPFHGVIYDRISTSFSPMVLRNTILLAYHVMSWGQGSQVYIMILIIEM